MQNPFPSKVTKTNLEWSKIYLKKKKRSERENNFWACEIFEQKNSFTVTKNKATVGRNKSRLDCKNTTILDLKINGNLFF